MFVCIRIFLCNMSHAMLHVTCLAHNSRSLNMCKLKQKHTHSHNRHQYNWPNLLNTRIWLWCFCQMIFFTCTNAHIVCRSFDVVQYIDWSNERCNTRITIFFYYAIHHIDLCIGSLCQCTVANQCTHCACCFIKLAIFFFFWIYLQVL